MIREIGVDTEHFPAGRTTMLFCLMFEKSVDPLFLNELQVVDQAQAESFSIPSIHSAYSNPFFGRFLCPRNL
jgi:hypothetical protein